MTTATISSLTAVRIGRHRQPITWRWRPSAATWIPLPLILAVQAGLSLRLIWSNTAFMDEALYLRAGHMEIAHWLHGTPLQTAYPFPTYFSGAPVIYPPLGALADSIGGLAGARLLSLAFMLTATGLLYATAFHLFDRTTAISAAAIFATLSTVQALGAFATYDAMALCLTAAAACLAVRAEGTWSELILVAAAFTMALADAAKYASALWNPVIIALVIITGQHGWIRAAARGVRLVLYLAALLAFAIFRLGGHPYITGIMYTTLNRGISGTNPAVQVLSAAFGWIGPVFLLAILGTIIGFMRHSDRITCLVLTTAVALAPVQQARIHTLTSLQKHVAFGAWFAAIAAGYAVGQVVQLFLSTDKHHWLAVTPASVITMIAGTIAGAAAVITALMGIYQAPTLFNYWPDQSQAVPIVSALMRHHHGPCLIAETNVFSYYLPRQIPDPDTSCTGSYSFGYWDPARQKYLTGLTAYTTAIHRHYFTIIEADQNESTAFYTPIITAAASSGYIRAASLHNTVGSRPTEIWYYQPVPRSWGPSWYPRMRNDAK